MLGLLLAVLLCVGSASAQAQRSPQPKALEGELQVTTVAKGLDHPWGIELLPDGALLVTERAGRLRMVTADGRISQPLTGVPKVFANGQGGLLDVVLSPNFAQDRLIYFSYAEPGEGGAGTAVARGRLGEGLVDAERSPGGFLLRVTGGSDFGPAG